jgi:putative peptidoglycan lipid II flippase
MIRSAGVVSGLTLVSRLLGLVRDILMAGVFHTSLAMSGFVVAFTIPNLFRRLFGEGALSAAFIPVFVKTQKEQGDEAAWSLARRISTLLLGVLTAITVVGVVAAQWGLTQAVPGSKTAVTLSLLRIMLPYMIFICLAALSMAMLNARRRFAVPAATPVLLNVVWILCLVAVVPRMDGPLEQKIVAVAWAVLVAGCVQLTFQLPALWREGFRPGFELAKGDERVRRVLILMGPAALGLAVAQINVMIDKLLAWWIGPWAPAALYYSERLLYLPLGIFATALGTVLLPVLSGHAAAGERDRIPPAINHGLRNLLFIMVPASMGLLVLARPIVTLVYQSGGFGQVATTQTVLALQFYAPGLVMFSLAKVFVPAFYAEQDTRTPVKVALWCVGLNLVLNIVFVLTWPPHLKHAGLAFATVLSSAVNGACLAGLVHRRFGSPGWSAITISALRSLALAAAMGFLAAGLHPLFYEWVRWTAWPIKYLQFAALMLTIAAASLAYFLLAWIIRAPEMRDILGGLRRGRGVESRMSNVE